MCAERGSWRRRLEWVRDLVRDGRADDPATLAYLGVFLKLVATGAIASKEDGGHYRPSHHAQLGLDIERMLLSGPARKQRSLIRGILRWLPSHDLPFRRAEPLTRIRDIAHRNDIPHALKDEIKRTLQNKLHRSAGPEDLKTSAQLLARFSQPGASYPEAFVAEFRRFHEELSAFFNAGSVEKDLEGLLAELPPAAVTPAKEFLAAFPLTLASPERIDGELVAITNLRRALEPAFSDAESAVAQKLRFVDLKLDERAFVLLAERTNRIEAAADAPSVDGLLNLVAEVSDQLAMSGVESEFTSVLAVAARPAGGEDERLLMARARFETARTVIGWYADRVLGECASFAAELGRRLQMPTYIAEQFAAREIRQNLAFQLSRLVDRGLALTAQVLKLPAWQVVVPGSAEGRLVAVSRLEQLGQLDQPTLVVVDRLDGDEEIPRQVRAILVGHDLPHLSHVAIRTRQAGVPMAARRDTRALEDFLAQQMEKPTFIAVDQRGISVRPAEGQRPSTTPHTQLGRVTATTDAVVVPLEKVTVETAGGKAWGARRLTELAGQGHFRAPPGFVLPFGVMETCLSRDPSREGERQALLSVLDDPGRSSDWANAGLRLQRLIETLALPEPLLRQLGEYAAPLDHIAVRSSSNAEDRKGGAGAGLFASVIGAKPQDLATAVCRVWASLYSRRALAACHGGQARVRDLSMAVLIEPVIPAQLSFVMYTQSPFAANDAYVELAAGLGETIAGAVADGSPYRMHIDRALHSHRLATCLSYADYLTLESDGELRRRPTRFHELAFERDRAWRQRLAERLAVAAEIVERELGGAQDVEGAIVADDVWLVQARPAALADGGAA